MAKKSKPRGLLFLFLGSDFFHEVSDGALHRRGKFSIVFDQGFFPRGECNRLVVLCEELRQRDPERVANHFQIRDRGHGPAGKGVCKGGLIDSRQFGEAIHAEIPLQSELIQPSNIELTL